MHTLMFLAARVLHVFVAASWIGSTVFMAFVLGPAIDGAGASGGQVMAHVERRGFHTYMAILAVTTVITGVYLFWRYSGGFDSEVVSSHTGIAFCVGGTAGIVALILGGGLVGRNGRTVVACMAAAMAAPDGPAREALVQRAAIARRRVKAGTKAVIALQTMALVLMTLAHYL